MTKIDIPIKYLGILENANLIYRSWPVRQDGKKALKEQAKVYIADAGIREAIICGLYAKDDPVRATVIDRSFTRGCGSLEKTALMR